MSLFHTTVFLSGRADDHILNCLFLRVHACVHVSAHLPPPALQAQTFAIYRKIGPSLIQAEKRLVLQMIMCKGVTIKRRFNRQRPTFIRYSLKSLTQWQEIGSFKLTEYPHKIKLLSIMLSFSSLSIFSSLPCSLAHTAACSLLPNSTPSSWAGFLKILRFGSHQEMCQAEQLKYSICIRDFLKKGWGGC